MPIQAYARSSKSFRHLASSILGIASDEHRSGTQPGIPELPLPSIQNAT